MKATITINGPTSVLTGDFPILDIKEATSYPSDGAQYSKAYRKGVWDGRVNLFKTKAGKFPTGLLYLVQEVLDEGDYPYEVIDTRPEPEIVEGGFDLIGISMTGKYAYQLDACHTMVKEQQGVIKIATNGGKTECACAVAQHLGLNALFIVTSKDLLYQAQARFQKRLGLGDDAIGIVGDTIWKPGSFITIAIMDTLVSRADQEECQDLLKNTEVLFIDEAHHAGSNTWFYVLEQISARFRFALSGTPLDRTDGADLRLLATTGKQIVDISNKTLVETGVSAQAHIVWDKITQPMLKSKGLKYNTVYKEGVVLNNELLYKIVDWTKISYQFGLSTMILTEEIEQGERIDNSLWNDTGGLFIPHQFIHGENSSTVRRDALADFSNRSLPVLVASRILDEGIDVPTIDVLILGGSRKSRIKTMQRLGRGLRDDKLIVIEFSNFTHKYLLEHSLQRYEDYQQERCFPLHQSGPNSELIKELWESM